MLPLFTFGRHWATNEQRGHLFGYWFGHDMFTPPFTEESGEPIYPEMAKDAASVTVFQRTPNFVMPAVQKPMTPEWETERKDNSHLAIKNMLYITS